MGSVTLLALQNAIVGVVLMYSIVMVKIRCKL